MSESDGSNYSDGGWIQWFCSLEDHDFFCEVDVEYIRDTFNLYGLKKLFTHYSEALSMILDPEGPEDEDLEEQHFLDIYQEATDLYGLIHARFIAAPKGLSVMREKYLAGVFGTCPRILCPNQYVLPVGLSETVRHSRVKVFCPRCEDIYAPKKKCADVDGAYFGCSFPHVLLQAYPDLAQKEPPTLYVPRIYGFKVQGKCGSKAWRQGETRKVTYYGEEKAENNPNLKIERSLRDD